MTYNIAFVGKSISHSLLPKVYQLIGEQIDTEILVTSFKYAETIKKILMELPKTGYQAACIAFPYKIDAFNQMNESTLTKRASRAGAINIIKYDKCEPILSDNTDGRGFIRDVIENKKIIFNNKNILILGAGGTARSILSSVIIENPASITICNRDKIKLEKFISSYGTLVNACDYETIPTKNFDIVINATSASIIDELPPVPDYILDQNTICLECAYKFQEMTAFANWALKRGALAYFDGLGMLIEQTAEAIMVLLNQRIQTNFLIEKLIKD